MTTSMGKLKKSYAERQGTNFEKAQKCFFLLRIFLFLGVQVGSLR